MKNLKSFLFIVLTIVVATSCQDRGNNGLFDCIKGEGNTVTEDLVIEEFHSIRLRGSSNVFITQSSDFQVTVKGQQNIIDNIELNVKNGEWEIEFEECQRDFTKLEFYITIPEVKSLEVSGSGDIIGENDFTVGDIDLKVDGSGSIQVTVIDAQDVDARISGSGKIDVKGSANYIGSKISGSGDLEAFDLETNIGNINISGAGDAEVTVFDELDVKISGSGDVNYKGNPLVNVDITGSGDLNNSN